MLHFFFFHMCEVVPLNTCLDTQISVLRFNCIKYPAVFNEITVLFALLKIITYAKLAILPLCKRLFPSLPVDFWAFCPQSKRPSQLNDSQSLTKDSTFSCSHDQPLSSTSPFFSYSLIFSACWFPASSWTFHTDWLWLAQLFILKYYPRTAITFFPLLSVSAPLSPAWPLNSLVSHLPSLSTIFSLSVLPLWLLWKPLITALRPPCFTSFPFSFLPSLPLSSYSSAGRVYKQGSLVMSHRNMPWHTVWTVQALLHPWVPQKALRREAEQKRNALQPLSCMLFFPLSI